MLEEENRLQAELLPVMLNEHKIAAEIVESLNDECVNLNPCRILVTKSQHLFEQKDT